jgi:beta-glucosidase
MTVEEKVGQLNQSAGIVMPGAGGKKLDELIAQGKVGSILWLNDVKDINRVQRLAVEKSR